MARLTAVEIDWRLAQALQIRLAGPKVQIIEGDATEILLHDQTCSAAVAVTL